MTCTDGEGPTLVVLSSYGRDSLHDFDCFTDQIVAASSAGPMISAGNR
jgi:hypothetical protein